MFLLTDIYQDADWRTVTRFCDIRQRIGIAFTLPDGQAVRFAVTADHARNIADSLNRFVATLPARTDDSLISVDPIHSGQSHT